MALGTTAASIVESPITEAKITAAMDTVLSATLLSGPVTITSFNQGRSVLVTANQTTTE